MRHACIHYPDAGIAGEHVVRVFHDAFDITEFELVGSIELLDDLAVLMPVLGSAGPEKVGYIGRGSGRGRLRLGLGREGHR